MTRSSALAALLLLASVALVASPAGATAAPAAHVTMHHFPSAGALLLVSPVGYDCVDVHTGAPVARGSVLASPSPGVSCSPSGAAGPETCSEVDAGGYHAVAGAGVLTVTSACGALSASQALVLPFSDPGHSTFVLGNGETPWTCVADESALLSAPNATDYWVFCDLNLPIPQPAQGGCLAPQATHTYGAFFPRSPILSESAAAPGAQTVHVSDSNLDDCNGDAIPGDFDGDYDTGDAGGFFGSSDAWDVTDNCGYGLNVHATTGTASDSSGAVVAGFYGVDDANGPSVVTDPNTGATVSCQTDGSITPMTTASDCLHAWVGTWSPGPCPASGGDDGYWLFLQPPFTTGTLTATT